MIKKKVAVDNLTQNAGCSARIKDGSRSLRGGNHHKGKADSRKIVNLTTGLIDHFVEQDGLVFAGKHLIVDLWGAIKLDQIGHIKATLEEIVRVCEATLLNIHLHRFTENGGVSGVALLAESHISIHTWPERDYAALDIFMCGDASPHRAISVLKQEFRPTSLHVAEHKRGVVP